MLQQNPDVSATSKSGAPKPELKEGQQVRILHGQYRGTVGEVSRIEWDEKLGEWLYDVSDGRVYLGVYPGKELW